MPIEDLPGLVDRWQQASGTRRRVELLRAGADLVGGLRGEDRHALARALATHGADELAARFDALGTGTSDDPDTLARHLLFLDRDQLRELAGDLRDPARRAAYHQAATANGGGVDDVVTEDLATEDVWPGAHPEAGDATGELDPTATAEDADLPTEAGSPADAGPLDDELEPAEGDAPAPAARVAECLPPPAAPTAAPRSGSRPHDERDPAAAPFAAADDARARFEALEARHGELTSGVELIAVLDAVPSGWQRRRVARRLLRRGDVHDVDPAAVLRRFARAGDRHAVAADLVAAYLATPEQLAAHLDASVVARLQRRAG